MKKIIILFAVLLAFSAQNNLKAQTDFDVVNFTAILSGVIDITVVTGNNQTASFTTAANYNLGVWEGAGIATGISTITCESTNNWFVQMKAADFLPASPLAIPINNLGVWMQATGAHTIATGEVVYTCIDAATTQGLTNADAMLINLGANPAGNKGDISDNAFTLHWRMGTRDNATMHATSMFDQMANGDFGLGTYSTQVILTMTSL
jgi:hypothetical protein